MPGMMNKPKFLTALNESHSEDASKSALNGRLYTNFIVTPKAQPSSPNKSTIQKKENLDKLNLIDEKIPLQDTGVAQGHSSAVSVLQINSEDALTSDGLARKPLHPTGTTQQCTTAIIVVDPSLTSTAPTMHTGKLTRYAICSFCSKFNETFVRCKFCNRPLTAQVNTYYKLQDKKIILKSTIPAIPAHISASPLISKNQFYNKTTGNNLVKSCPPKVAPQPTVRTPQQPTIRKSATARKPAETKNTRKRNLADQPVCLTISSDEEEDTKEKESVTDNQDNATNQSPLSTTPKRKLLLDPESSSCKKTSTQGELDSSSKVSKLTKNSNDDDDEDNDIVLQQTRLNCRSIRVGSYKFAPSGLVKINKEGFNFKVPALFEENEEYDINVSHGNICKLMCHFGKNLPIVIMFTTPGHGNALRSRLRMNNSLGPFYDPGSKDETQKRIIMLPSAISEKQAVTIKLIFKDLKVRSNETTKMDCVFEEIDETMANEILVRSTPREVIQNVKDIVASPHQRITRSSTQSSPAVQDTEPVVTLFTYPPQTGGIPINTNDLACLEEGQFLNDAIIDFYLKYVFNNLDETDKSRTHICSTFFYKRLTFCPNKSNAAQFEDTSLPPVERRHSRVKTWTRNVDIFEKDFVIIPINESYHWFLAVVCFPYLCGDEFKNANLSNASSNLLNKLKLQPISPTVSVIQTTKNDVEEKENETENEELEEMEDDELEYSCEEVVTTSPNEDQNMEVKSEITKRPCILVFDSLPGRTWGKGLRCIREYLQVEWKVKKSSVRNFTTLNMPGYYPKVPIQTNFSDCGLYLLQYVQSLFQNPIQSFSSKTFSLQEWFPLEVVENKRAEIFELIMQLSKERQKQLSADSSKDQEKEQETNCTNSEKKPSLQNCHQESMSVNEDN